MTKKKGKLKNVLIVRPDALGDVTLMIPMINTIKATYPNSKITVLLQKYAAPLLNNHPNVDALIIDKKKEGKCNSIIDFFKYAKEIKSYKFDTVIFSYLDGFYALLMVLAKIPVRVGDGQKIMIRQLLTHPVNQYFRRLAIHETEQNIRLLDALNTPLKIDTTMNLNCDQAADITIKGLLSEFKCKPNDYIVIHPATGGGNRAWLPQKYAELINLIHKKTKFKVIVTGFGKNEKIINESIFQDCIKKPINCFERTSLQELKSLIKSAKLIVGTDTGPTHIAAALNIPVICISPTKFVKSLRWGPWETKNKIIGNPQACDLVCNPYLCEKLICLDAISAEHVFEELVKISDEKFYKAKMKQNWLLASVNIGLVVTNENSFKKINSIMDLYKEAPFKVNFLTNSLKIEQLLKKKYKNIKCTRFSTLLFPLLIRKLSKQDINLIHLFPQRKSWLWTFIIRQLAAPFMYCPPLIMPLGPLPNTASQLIDLYIEAFSQET
ncbi:hypothetical protein DID80_02900 [Candidatus Marinamargulisbacteria bacterium SCGC AAA071-K20]|nr:hypothetical protein DID80_02900 [Candidatus Marinamargulisbacteria bacterium SCGC AAA071-K20]